MVDRERVPRVSDVDRVVGADAHGRDNAIVVAVLVDLAVGSRAAVCVHVAALKVAAFHLVVAFERANGVHGRGHASRQVRWAGLLEQAALDALGHADITIILGLARLIR